MKKIIIFFQIIFFLSISIPSYAEDIDTSGWYVYLDSSLLHPFSVSFPTDWKIKTVGDDMEIITPAAVKENKEEFIIKEFEGQTYEQVINSYIDENIEMLEIKDKILPNKEDILAKEVTYKNNLENKEFLMTFIKRGSVIISLTNPIAGSENENILNAIYNSFTFEDKWHQYIDFENKYTFIFPANFGIGNLSNGVEISDPGHYGSKIFTILKFEDTSMAEAVLTAAAYNESFEESLEILFHGIEKVLSATYYDNDSKKELNKILIEKDGNSFSLTNLNIENNFPHLDYYDTYLAEILESFEFFDIEGEYHSYIYFTDIRDNHPNAEAINYLAGKEVISGYQDKTFKPDNKINRAELTKMIVASKVTPDSSKYNNCFKDVKNEWFAPYICYAKEQNWVSGYEDGDFKPEQNINRAEAIKIISEVMFENIPNNLELNNKTVLDVEKGAWYENYFIFADNNNLLDKQHIKTENGKYYYLIFEDITRKEVAEMIYRSMK